MTGASRPIGCWGWGPASRRPTARPGIPTHFNFRPSKRSHRYRAGRDRPQLPTEIGAVADMRQAMKVLNALGGRDAAQGALQPRLAAPSRRFELLPGDETLRWRLRPPSDDAERILADLRAVMRATRSSPDVGWNRTASASNSRSSSRVDPHPRGSRPWASALAALGSARPSERRRRLVVGDGGFGRTRPCGHRRGRNLGGGWGGDEQQAFGTIAGRSRRISGCPTAPSSPSRWGTDADYAAIARPTASTAWGAFGRRMRRRSPLPSLGGPTVIDLAMIKNPTPTTGLWDILTSIRQTGMSAMSRRLRRARPASTTTGTLGCDLALVLKDRTSTFLGTRSRRSTGRPRCWTSWPVPAGRRAAGVGIGLRQSNHRGLAGRLDTRGLGQAAGIVLNAGR